MKYNIKFECHENTYLPVCLRISLKAWKSEIAAEIKDASFRAKRHNFFYFLRPANNRFSHRSSKLSNSSRRSNPTIPTTVLEYENFYFCLLFMRKRRRVYYNVLLSLLLLLLFMIMGTTRSANTGERSRHRLFRIIPKWCAGRMRIVPLRRPPANNNDNWNTANIDPLNDNGKKTTKT